MDTILDFAIKSLEVAHELSMQKDADPIALLKRIEAITSASLEQLWVLTRNRTIDKP